MTTCLLVGTENNYFKENKLRSCMEMTPSIVIGVVGKILDYTNKGIDFSKY